MFRNKSNGTLNVGEPFDAVLLSQDLTKQNLDGYLATEVLAVYSRGSKLFPHNDH
jgi:hypothetical protein